MRLSVSDVWKWHPLVTLVVVVGPRIGSSISLLTGEGCAPALLTHHLAKGATPPPYRCDPICGDGLIAGPLGRWLERWTDTELQSRRRKMGGLEGFALT